VTVACIAVDVQDDFTDKDRAESELAVAGAEIVLGIVVGP
jgi:hypothetical protein